VRSSKYIQLMGKTYATDESLTETSKWVGNEDDVFSDALYDDNMMSCGGLARSLPVAVKASWSIPQCGFLVAPCAFWLPKLATSRFR
jgi:hypothetical protein